MANIPDPLPHALTDEALINDLICSVVADTCDGIRADSDRTTALQTEILNRMADRPAAGGMR